MLILHAAARADSLQRPLTCTLWHRSSIGHRPTHPNFPWMAPGELAEAQRRLCKEALPSVVALKPAAVFRAGEEAGSCVPPGLEMSSPIHVSVPGKGCAAFIPRGLFSSRSLCSSWQGKGLDLVSSTRHSASSSLHQDRFFLVIQLLVQYHNA